MTLSEYQRLAQRTVNPKLTATDLTLHALHGMSGEVGELHSIYQKIYQGHDFNPEHARSELGDLLWFIAEYATANGWSLDEIASVNISKLLARYPDGFDTNKSMHRREGDI